MSEKHRTLRSTRERHQKEVDTVESPVMKPHKDLSGFPMRGVIGQEADFHHVSFSIDLVGNLASGGKPIYRVAPFSFKKAITDVELDSR